MSVLFTLSVLGWQCKVSRNTLAMTWLSGVVWIYNYGIKVIMLQWESFCYREVWRNRLRSHKTQSDVIHREDRFVHRMFGVLGEWWLKNWWTCLESWFYNRLCISLFVNTFSFPCSQFYHLFVI